VAACRSIEILRKYGFDVLAPYIFHEGQPKERTTCPVHGGCASLS
jgi:hypothetical protein